MMLASGRLNDIDVALYRSLARFNTLQQNFLQMIKGDNQYQRQYLTPHLVLQPFFSLTAAWRRTYCAKSITNTRNSSPRVRQKAQLSNTGLLHSRQCRHDVFISHCAITFELKGGLRCLQRGLL